VYFVVDKSASMQGALERAQDYLAKFLGGFPLDRIHVSVFNTVGKEIAIKAPKSAAVKAAFRGHSAGGGTSYAQGFLAIAKNKPKEDEDALVIFVGDEEDNGVGQLAQAITGSGINPVAFGLLKVQSSGWFGGGYGSIVTDTATHLGIPCFSIDENMFTSDDPYAVTRILGDLIANTPVGARAGGMRVQRKPLVQEILETPLLQKPVWA
jgi:hypothetical protein